MAVNPAKFRTLLGNSKHPQRNLMNEMCIRVHVLSIFFRCGLGGGWVDRFKKIQTYFGLEKKTSVIMDGPRT